MVPPVYPILSANAAVVALLGNPIRCYPFGSAPQGVQDPYVVWQVIGGAAENYLQDRPDADSYDVQMDVYGRDEADVLAVAKAIRDAMEARAYISRWGGHSQDPATKRWRVNFDASFLHLRL
ncbi:DUF3168 domain-containing protein [Alcanivorax sp. S6407]|uniref:DUF3168 domain-containing protein n=1 Tax=Alcanivorax sp. S6407 TaxID=2926424 RepID=UPI001FF2262A|nr:DUF3168 domain-containing protein [Alcanivorax sp. S6407]MCK0153858.1 DUF3168 domain-containing protein [Alcanivorax sp. S6407]